jgi:hypothetical protein
MAPIPNNDRKKFVSSFVNAVPEQMFINDLTNFLSSILDWMLHQHESINNI